MANPMCTQVTTELRLWLEMGLQRLGLLFGHNEQVAGVSINNMYVLLLTNQGL